MHGRSLLRTRMTSVSAGRLGRARFSRRHGMSSILLGKEVDKLLVSNGLSCIANRVYIPRNYGGVGCCDLLVAMPMSRLLLYEDYCEASLFVRSGVFELPFTKACFRGKAAVVQFRWYGRLRTAEELPAADAPQAAARRSALMEQ